MADGVSAVAFCGIVLGSYVTKLQLELLAAAPPLLQSRGGHPADRPDPYPAVVEGVTGAAKWLIFPVLERLHEVTSACPVTEAEQANRVIRCECAGRRWAELGSELGLRIRLYGWLWVDARVIECTDQEEDAHAEAEVTRVHQEMMRSVLQRQGAGAADLYVGGPSRGARTSRSRPARRGGRTTGTASNCSSARSPIAARSQTLEDPGSERVQPGPPRHPGEPSARCCSSGARAAGTVWDR